MIVLFDLGQVLVYPLREKDLFEFIKPEISYDDFCNYWKNSKTLDDAHQGLILDTYYIKCLLEYCKSKVSIQEFYDKYITMTNGIYTDTAEIIKELKEKNIKTGVLSNLREMDHIRHKEEIEQFKFDYLFLSYRMKKIKPNADIYEKVIEECNCNPNEIYFFDDVKINVDMAKRSGINAYQVTGENIKEIFNNLEKEIIED